MARWVRWDDTDMVNTDNLAYVQVRQLGDTWHVYAWSVGSSPGDFLERVFPTKNTAEIFVVSLTGKQH